MLECSIHLARRRGDVAILAFFIINLLFITYVVDIEQLIIPDPYHFSYPAWPPAAAVDLIHWYGNTFDPVLMARPAWWKATIWIDALFFGPYYVFAIYAFARGRNWIRIPSIIYASMMLTNVIIILSEEIYGAHATPQLPVVIGVNLPWLLFPIIILVRMGTSPAPFSRSLLSDGSHPSFGRELDAAAPTAGES